MVRRPSPYLFLAGATLSAFGIGFGSGRMTARWGMTTAKVPASATLQPNGFTRIRVRHIPEACEPGTAWEEDGQPYCCVEEPKP